MPQVDAEDSLTGVHEAIEARACSRAWTTCRTSPRLVGGRRRQSKHAEPAGWREQPVALPQRIPADGVEDQSDSPSTYDLSRPRFKVLGSVIDQLIIADGLAFAIQIRRMAESSSGNELVVGVIDCPRSNASIDRHSATTAMSAMSPPTQS
jgi:hypothetical protein